MSQFDVHQVVGRLGRAQYVIDIQADLLDEIGTRLVAPLRPLKNRADLLPRVTPVVQVKGETYFIMLPEIAAIRVKELGATVANLGQHRDEIIAAIDLLFTGV